MSNDPRDPGFVPLMFREFELSARIREDGDDAPELPVMRYKETGEHQYQVKVLNDAGQQQGEALLLTETQLSELEDSLPQGWTAEYA